MRKMQYLGALNSIFLKFIFICTCLLQISTGIASALPENELLRQQLERLNTSPNLPTVAGEVLNNYSELLTFYEQRSFKPLWLKGRTLTKSGTDLLQAISTIDGDGLKPSDYHFQALESLTDKNDALSTEILLSDGLLTLANHLLSGKVDPTSLTSEWKASPRRKNLHIFLQNIADGQTIAQLLNQARPNQIRYHRLVEHLQRLRNMPHQDWPELDLTPAIKPGMSDPRLSDISARLKWWGDLKPEHQETGTYNDDLVQATKAFQVRHGLEADGIIGRNTFEALNITPEKRIRQIEVNLERWRWLAEEFGERHIFVNIASFELKLIDKGVTIMRQSVVVGKSQRKTPVFSDQIRYIVFNPTWTVPYKLATQDKLPEIKKNPGYLTDFGFKVYDSYTGSEVAPESVDWSNLSSKHFPYQLVQTPGQYNALGKVKFMFPNPFNVYLHDTPSKDLFAKPDRAFSSGCIRLSKPLDLAKLLLDDAEWDQQRIDNIITAGQTKTVNLKSPVPVHIEYWTTWVEKDDSLNFRKDVYQRDEPLWAALQLPLNKGTSD